MEPGPNEYRNRQASVSGKFYPGTAKKLREEVEALFKNAKPDADSGILPRALIVPHAGYIFSGKVAASAFNRLSPGHAPNRVFVLASSHHFHFPGASVYCSGNYETPLGTVSVDCKTGKKIAGENASVSDRADVHLPEHSIEVQLPFLQMQLGNSFRLVPIILGTQQPEECRRLAEILRPYFTPENLFVISSDLSHYPGYEDAITTDRATSKAIISNSPANLLKTLEQNSRHKTPGLVTSLCGWTSVLTLLYLTEGKDYVYEWIDYQNSGDQPVYGDHSRVVGYSAVAVYDKKGNEFDLDSEEKKKLLLIARNSIRHKVISGKKNPLDAALVTGRLAECCGAFVSVYIAGKLRGCIGSFDNRTNNMAAAATGDRRFLPVSTDELTDLSVEISVLSPLKKIKSPREIVLGKHGIYIKKGWSSGTFLPQVAEKQEWTVDEFLGHCSRDKAGIGWEGWKTAELYTYEAIVFSGK